ncbi:MAG: acetate--CoA ligase family protein [Syntrophobacteraceae bacterium]
MQRFFDPRSVVLIGVTRQSGPGSYNNLEVMKRFGFRGTIHVVHPKVEEILGHRTVRNVSELPETPDLAVISLGRDRVLPVFKECIDKGIGHVVLISQGFADADERGKELQAELQAMAKSAGTRVVGPNTMGIWNAFNRFSTAFVETEDDPSPPPITLVAQSGVFQVGYESFTGRLGKAIDVGNCVDVDFVDSLEYLENDPETRIIVLHMEGMHRGRDFLHVASRITPHKPIIVLKTGRSAAGAEAALSHTGSLVGEDAIFDVAFKRAGILRVRSMIELKAVCNAFLNFGSVSGPSLGVVTATGAIGILTADACEDFGFEIGPFPEHLREGLENPHIVWHKLRNPVDIWPLGMVAGSFTKVFNDAAKGLLDDERIDAILGIAPTMRSPLHADLDMVTTAKEVNRHNRQGKPIALWLYGGDQEGQSKALEGEPNVGCFGSVDEAVMGLAGLWRYHGGLKHARPIEPSPYATSASQKAGSAPGANLVVGTAAEEMLRPYEIPFVPGKLAQNVLEASTIASETGYPVVLKIISPQWLHKSDWGGIRLNVGSKDELEQAFAKLEQLFRERTPDGALDGILVQRQIVGQELLIGVKKDAQFGPLVVVGMGGIYTEVFKDVARALVPVDGDEAGSMLKSLRLFPLLNGARGQKGVHLPSVERVIVNVSTMIQEHPEIAELDLNPVMATPDGCWAVDCRIILD